MERTHSTMPHQHKKKIEIKFILSNNLFLTAYKDQNFVTEQKKDENRNIHVPVH